MSLILHQVGKPKPNGHRADTQPHSWASNLVCSPVQSYLTCGREIIKVTASSDSCWTSTLAATFDEEGGPSQWKFLHLPHHSSLPSELTFHDRQRLSVPRRAGSAAEEGCGREKGSCVCAHLRRLQARWDQSPLLVRLLGRTAKPLLALPLALPLPLRAPSASSPVQQKHLGLLAVCS